MSDQIFIARQPIFDSENEIFGYELFYRNPEGTSDADNPRFATSTVLVNLLNQIGRQKCVGDAKAFINIDSGLLLTDIISSLPTDIFVFEISREMVITNREIEAVAHLRRLGYTFALDNVSLTREYHKEFSPLFPYVTYAKFDTMMTDFELIESQVKIFSGFTLIAQKIEFSEMYESYKALGFEYFQGNFFAQPVLIQQEGISPKHLGVIRIYNMLQNGEPLEQVAEELQHHNELSMQLLQFVGSTAMYKEAGASSIRSVLEQIGEKRLQLWLLLIIYSKSGKYISNDKSTFSLNIQKRIDIMLDLMPRLGIEANEGIVEQVRFLAFLSLIEETFGIPLASILENVDIDDAIEAALMSKFGEFGHLLGLAEEIESSNIAKIHVYLKHYHLTIDAVDDIIAKYQKG
jgi:EAL and modified HD-GYP domain-containing signal transduction protein